MSDGGVQMEKLPAEAYGDRHPSVSITCFISPDNTKCLWGGGVACVYTCLALCSGWSKQSFTFIFEQVAAVFRKASSVATKTNCTNSVLFMAHLCQNIRFLFPNKNCKECNVQFVKLIILPQNNACAVPAVTDFTFCSFFEASHCNRKNGILLYQALPMPFMRGWNSRHERIIQIRIWFRSWYWLHNSFLPQCFWKKIK